MESCTITSIKICYRNFSVGKIKAEQIYDSIYDAPLVTVTLLEDGRLGIDALADDPFFALDSEFTNLVSDCILNAKHRLCIVFVFTYLLYGVVLFVSIKIIRKNSRAQLVQMKRKRQYLFF